MPENSSGIITVSFGFIVMTSTDPKIDEVSSVPEPFPTSRPKRRQGRRALRTRLRRHGQRALSNTSAHGFNRLAVSDNWLARAVWLAVIIGGVGMFTLHVYTLVSRYHSKPTSMRFLPNHAPFEWPDIYICPLKPLSELKLFMRNITDTKERDLTKRVIKNMADVYEKIGDKNWPWYEFRQSINLQEFRDAACLTVDEMLIRIYGVYPVNARIVYHPVYTCCAVIDKIPKKVRGRKTRLYADIYADNSDYNVTAPYLRDIRGSYSGNGIRIIFVPKKHYPEMQFNSVTISPRFITYITVTQTKLKNHPHKHSCTTKPKLVSILDYFTLNKSDYFNTEDICKSETIMAKLTKSYNCSQFSYYYMADFRNYTRCGNFSIHNSTTIRLAHKKLHKYAEAVSQSNVCQKNSHCTKTFYEAKSSMAKFKSPTAAIWRFQRSVLSLWSVNRQHSSNKNLIRDSFIKNFATVIIDTTATGATYIIEDMAYPLSNLFSDIGGILGLYIGISVLTLFELVEFLVTIISIVCHTGCRRQGQPLELVQVVRPST